MIALDVVREQLPHSEQRGAFSAAACLSRPQPTHGLLDLSLLIEGTSKIDLCLRLAAKCARVQFLE